MAPVDTLFSATRDAAQLLGKADDIGSLKAGRLADIIAVDGDPLQDITTMEHVSFAMQGGAVIKNSKP
jgi:imidazolonepropionase-like amidohydrolase